MMPRPFAPDPSPQSTIARAREGPSLDTLPGLLVALGVAGIELGRHPADPGRLRHRPATLLPDLLEGLQRHRAAILALLDTFDGKGGYAPAGEDAAIVCGERLGMADGLGMRTHPGSPAWLVAVGEAVCCFGIDTGEPRILEGEKCNDSGWTV